MLLKSIRAAIRRIQERAKLEKFEMICPNCHQIVNVEKQSSLCPHPAITEVLKP
jgi:predicted HNH restriction endonuclease